MTFAAGIFLRMVLVCEGNRHPGTCEVQICQLMATFADVLIQISFLMWFYYMALVTVNPEVYMFWM